MSYAGICLLRFRSGLAGAVGQQRRRRPQSKCRTVAATTRGGADEHGRLQQLNRCVLTVRGPRASGTTAVRWRISGRVRGPRAQPSCLCDNTPDSGFLSVTTVSTVFLGRLMAPPHGAKRGSLQSDPPGAKPLSCAIPLMRSRHSGHAQPACQPGFAIQRAGPLCAESPRDHCRRHFLRAEPSVRLTIRDVNAFGQRSQPELRLELRSAIARATSADEAPILGGIHGGP